MVARLSALLDNLQTTPSIHRRIGDDAEEHFFAEVIRARAGNQHATGIKKLQRPQIDFLVAARARFDRRAAFRKRRRIENDGIESLARGLHFPQRVKNIPGLEFNVSRVVQLGVALRRRDRFL